MTTDEENNKNIETIFDLLNEKEMHEELETLTTVVHGYNSSIDETVSLLTNMVENTENVNLQYTDFLFVMLCAYSLFCFFSHADLFGVFFGFSILLLWAWRDVVLKISGIWKR
jgi:hypothetical protein